MSTAPTAAPAPAGAAPGLVTLRLPSAFVVRLLEREPLPTGVLRALWDAPPAFNGVTTVTATREAAGWLRDRSTTVITLPSNVLAHLAASGASDARAPHAAFMTSRRVEVEWGRRSYESTMTVDLEVLDWLALHLNALTWEFIGHRTTATQARGFTVYAVDAARMEVSAAQRELIDA
ncbi:hypothetical protein ACIOUE_07095 [Streptomyces xanthochromogenes]|uniref:hypothetical protein n=1 Tax=Streptomyces xanthochromogenes TaxID=67384 RepID=UPI00342F458B